MKIKLPFLLVINLAICTLLFSNCGSFKKCGTEYANTQEHPNCSESSTDTPVNVTNTPPVNSTVPSLSSDATITQYSLLVSSTSYVGTITGSSISITAVPFGSDVSASVATFTVHSGASMACGATVDAVTPQTSGTTSNAFTSPLKCIVTAEDGKTTATYTITVTISADNSTVISQEYFTSGKNIYGIDSSGPHDASAIDTNAHTIYIEIFNTIKPDTLVANFTVPTGASMKCGVILQDSGTTSNDYTTPLSCIVTAADGITTADYTITVNPDLGL